MPTQTKSLRRRQWKWIGHLLRMQNEAHARTAQGWRPEREGDQSYLERDYRRTNGQSRMDYVGRGSNSSEQPKVVEKMHQGLMRLMALRERRSYW
jgi:hypothetical protein